ncbi:MAG: hypothetical protein L6R38_001331 [Xanthoria sp. 2 TBL-2021]|nr:MAG: hypothetical protein L6R38_001331 [Xanthoria sp. 2 TBL-2021]
MADHCEALRSPNAWNFALSLFILFGILISYLPQHYRIIARRSSEGISPYFVLLGTTSGTFAFANILTLPTSRADLACCSEISAFGCFAGTLGVAQIGVQWSCFTVILLLFLLFFPRASPLSPPQPPASAAPSYRTAVLVVGICIVHIFLTAIVHLIFIYRLPSLLKGCAEFFGIAGTILAAIQFLPQIYTTWRLQAVGSLSIPMMCIQTPGSFVWVGSLAGRLGVAGWSTWGIYLVTGVLQGVLLVMAIGFEMRDRRDRKKNHADGPGRTNETLRNGNGTAQERQNNERTSLLGAEARD